MAESLDLDLDQEADRLLLQLVQFVEDNPVRSIEVCRRRCTRLPEGDRSKLNKFAAAVASKCDNSKSRQKRRLNVSESPPKRRQKLSNIVEIDHSEPPLDDPQQRRQKLFDISNIELGSVEDSLKKWTSDFKSFFEQCPQNASNCTIFSAKYIKLRRSDEGRAVLDVKRRFELASLYNSAVTFNYHTGTEWRKGGCNCLATAISGEFPDNFQEENESIESHLKRYIELGHGFNEWAKCLGGVGYLMLLPLAVPESTCAYLSHSVFSC
jgi:hypothetical protein